MAKRILISDATSYKAVVICEFIKKAYKDKDVEIYTCDSRKASRLFHTKYTNNHVVLKYDIDSGEGYVKEVSNIVRDYAIDIFIPVNSREMDILMADKDRFGHALSYWGEYESFKMLNEKDRLVELCRTCGVRMPETYKDASEVQFPAVIKPVVSSSAKGVRYCMSEGDLDRLLHSEIDISQMTIQEYVRGEGIGYSLFAVNGAITDGFGHRRLLEYPISGGSSTYRGTYNDRRMVEAAGKILAEVNWSGFAMFEFKLTPEGEVCLIEINPRIWGSINQGLQNGVNYFRALLGDSSMVHTQNKNTYFPPLVYLSLLRHIVSGEIQPVFQFLKNIPTNKADINIFNDFGAWMGTIVRICQGA